MSESDRASEARALAAFVARERRDRYLTLIGSRKGRDTLRRQLAHFRHFDRRFIREISARQQTADGILALLLEHGAPATCFVTSESDALDSRRMRLDDALTRIVGGGVVAVLSCVDGRLAYYEGEEPGERFILSRL